MKKILFAALLAVTGTASAQVSLYGSINQYITDTKTGAVSKKGTASDISNIGFKVTEDLGSGLKARVQVETTILANDPIANTNTTQLGDRQSTVGFAHALGSVDVGRNVHNTFVTISNNDPFAALIGSIAGDVHNLRGLRISNAAFVNATPIAGLNVGFDRGQATNITNVWSTAASYQYGAANVAVSRYEDTLAHAKSTVAGANVTFGPTTVFYSHSENVDGAAKIKGDLIGVQQKLTGVVSAKASYGKTDRDVRAWNVGLGYNFSKRTLAEVVYRDLDRTGTVNDSKMVAVGIRHSF
jgi:predicted porin